MFQFGGSPLSLPGPSSLDRRGFMQLGLAGMAGLTWPGLNRLRAESGRPAAKRHERTAVILVWLRGGCSHLDTYDPKPDAGSDYAGPFRPISTKIPGLQLTELLPARRRLPTSSPCSGPWFTAEVVTPRDPSKCSPAIPMRPTNAFPNIPTG
ncbi:MAG: DUF1501 domain-containing protein [Verrucomicrobiales bacterium]